MVGNKMYDFSLKKKKQSFGNECNHELIIFSTKKGFKGVV